jgi:diphosphomevalonate decarboxylase
MSPSPIYMATVSAPTNIAVIKYWGKASVQHNTPINDSVSVTLADLKAVTTVAASDDFVQDTLWLNGVETTINDRFRACVECVKKLASAEWQTRKIHVSSYNTFPTAAGLASSAAGYAALVAALAQLMNAKEEFQGQLSTIARQGSGSACRSLYGGFVAWQRGSPPDWTDSKAKQIADENHWPEIRALILVVSDLQKDTSSTAGMSTSVATSTLLAHRASAIVPQRMMDMEKAWLAKDFDAFGKLTMQDSNQFHAVCMDTYPPIFYMNDVSRTIVRYLTAYNEWAGEIRAAYTFDAGPNAVLYCLDKYVVELCALMVRCFPASDAKNRDEYLNSLCEYSKEIETFDLSVDLLEACDKVGRVPGSGHIKQFYLTKVGPGPQVLGPESANLDPVTGLNVYVAK